jgi:YesN/AraC family two-component response regulator
MAAAWAETGRDRRELESAYRALPLATPEQVEALLDLFSLTINHIVSQHMIALGGESALETLLSYMEEHVTEAITVEDAARVIQRSPSTVSHLFSRHIGRSFKQVLIEMKLQHAEAYMQAHPEATIADAAASAGYADPLYFSRLYRRYRCTSPSAYLRAVRGGLHGACL